MGEYTTQDKTGWRWDRVLTGQDVTPRCKGKEVQRFQDTDEVVVYIKGSKTNQYNAGCVRNHYRSGGTVCPVAVMDKLQRLFPERWMQEAHMPLFRLRSGRMLPCATLTKLAKEAGQLAE